MHDDLVPDDKRSISAYVIWVGFTPPGATLAIATTLEKVQFAAPLCKRVLNRRGEKEGEREGEGSFRLTKLMEISSHYVDDDFWRSWTNTLTTRPPSGRLPLKEIWWHTLSL